jgi:hypothetical protein
MVLEPSGAWAKVRPALAVTLPLSAATGLLAWLTGFLTTRGTDYFYYYCVSRLVFAGHGGSAYDSRVLGALERHLLAPKGVPGGVIPNVYPPFFAVALAPLAGMEYTPGFVLWTALNCIAFGASLAFLVRFARLGPVGGTGFGLAAYLSLPALVALILGQASFLLLAALCIVVYATLAGRQVLCGAALALMLIKPQFVLPFLLVLAVRGQWRAVSTFAVAASALVVTPLLILGPGAPGEYVHALMQATHWGSEVGGFAPADNRSVAGLLRLLLPATFSMPISIVIDIVALAGLAALARRAASLDALLALATLVALLISQHVLIHDLVLLLFPAAVALRRRDECTWRSALLWALGYLTLIVGFRPVLGGHIQIVTVWMVVCALWLAAPVSPWARQGRVRHVTPEPGRLGAKAVTPAE